MSTASDSKQIPILYDRLLLIVILAIIAMGLLMVASASVVVSDKLFGSSFHFLWRQLTYLTVGVIAAIIVMRIPIQSWQEISPILLFISFALLVLVLIPGIGRTVNGSTRWIGFAGVAFQISEFAKLSMIIFLASYLQRREQEIQHHLSGFVKPMAILGIFAVLLLAEPDFGATVVIMATALCMMFLAGGRLWQFIILVVGVVLALAGLAISSPYRMERLTSFLNPWANQFDSGYQLTQSLIAFGRGGWLGVGLGESVQKLFYLPEAHTDFLFAVIGEELGLLGVFAVIFLFVILVTRALQIGRTALLAERKFAGYLALGIGLWLAFQAMINIGVTIGVLPTKGLTLPFMSYGGSSMVVNCVAAALLLRLDYELRAERFGLAF